MDANTHTHTHKELFFKTFLYFSPLSLPLPPLSAEEEDDAGYLDVAVSEVKHPPPQLSPMPEGLTSHQVHQIVVYFSPLLPVYTLLYKVFILILLVIHFM